MILPEKIEPRASRVALIAKRVAASDETNVLHDFRGTSAKLPVIRLALGALVYRMENCRTYSDQRDLIAKRKLDEGHFEKGQELLAVQREQHSLLSKLAKKGTGSVSPIIDELKKDGQRDPILISDAGVVINGNRRLAAMRELFHENSDPNAAFSHIQCMVLPEDTTPIEIDDIEATLQARKQTKLDYDWIGDAQLVQRQIRNGKTTAEIASLFRRRESDIKLLQKAIIEADLFLQEWLGRPGEYTQISSDAEQIFTDLPKQLANKTPELQEASRVIAWSLYENKATVPGRLYSYNVAFGKLAESVLTLVAEELDISTTEISDDSKDGEDDFVVDFEDEETELTYQNVVNALRNKDTKEEAVKALISACQSAIETEKGIKSKNAALKTIMQVNAKLSGVDLSGAGQSTLTTIDKQLDTIGTTIKTLKEKLARLQK